MIPSMTDPLFSDYVDGEHLCKRNNPDAPTVQGKCAKCYGYTCEDTLITRGPQSEEDLVNNPSHYNQAGIECIDAIHAATDEGFEYYLQGNIIKYMWRYRYKNGVEDLKKAQWYLTKLIEVKET